jgi:hypothetical protein
MESLCQVSRKPVESGEDFDGGHEWQLVRKTQFIPVLGDGDQDRDGEVTALAAQQFPVPPLAAASALGSASDGTCKLHQHLDRVDTIPVRRDFLEMLSQQLVPQSKIMIAEVPDVLKETFLIQI